VVFQDFAPDTLGIAQCLIPKSTYYYLLSKCKVLPSDCGCRGARRAGEQ
jgi:hypothetical protein